MADGLKPVPIKTPSSQNDDLRLLGDGDLDSGFSEFFGGGGGSVGASEGLREAAACRWPGRVDGIASSSRSLARLVAMSRRALRGSPPADEAPAKDGARQEATQKE